MSELNKRQAKKAQRLERKKQKYYQKYNITIDEVNEILIKKGKVKDKKGDSNVAVNAGGVGAKYFAKYYKKYIGNILSIVLFSILVIVVNFLSMPLIQYITDFVVAKEYIQAIYAALVLLGAAMLDLLVKYAMNICFVKMNASATREIRNDLGKRVLNTESKSYRTLTTGEIVQRVSSDPGNFVSKVADAWYFMRDTITNFAILAYFFIIDVWLGLAVAFVCVVDAILLKLKLKYRLPKVTRNSALADKQNSHITEFVRGSDDVKSLNIKSNIFSIFSKWSDARFRGNLDIAYYTNSMTYGASIIREGLMIGYVILAIFLMMKGHFGLGAFVVLIRYFRTPAVLGSCFNSMFSNFQDAKVSMRRMAQVYDETKYVQEKFGDKELPDFKGGIEFKKVTFEYEKQKVLRDISFEVKPNETFAIVGKSGEGKSTILSLINRLIDTKKGKVLFDGVDNKKLTEQALRGAVSLVPQAPYIFNATIRENLLFANANATEADMIEALKQAQFYDFVMSKPEGLDAKVGEGGITLSGGQRQRLAIARAFLTDCKVLMLDEATSALDNENQEGIKNVINNLKQKCTFIIVAHRLSTVVDCDKIMVINDHKIEAIDTHKELIKTCPVYIDLYKLEGEEKKN